MNIDDHWFDASELWGFTERKNILAEVKRLRERVATLESLMEYMADEEKVIE